MVAVEPDTMVWLAGWVVMLAATPMVMAAVFQFAVPYRFDTRTQDLVADYPCGRRRPGRIAVLLGVCREARGPPRRDRQRQAVRGPAVGGGIEHGDRRVRPRRRHIGRQDRRRQLGRRPVRRHAIRAV